MFGPQNAGKTSLMRTTCLGYNFMKVVNLKPTKGVSRENFIFRGIMELNIWDAGGQERYMERYFSDKREVIFSEITTSVFMVDSTVTDPKVREIFDKYLEYLFEYSPHLQKVYVLINKIDLENSREDEFFELLTSGMDEELRNKVMFTPVSVKEGSAQHRLIEILDYEIQKSTISMQKLGKIRHLIDQLKTDTSSEYLLFNQPDGLLIASTFGKFEIKPLQFMKLELGTVESNIYQIYQNIMDLLNTTPTPLNLSMIVYESENNLVLLKDVHEGAVLMCVTKSKKPEVFSGVMNAFSGEIFDEIKDFIKNM